MAAYNSSDVMDLDELCEYINLSKSTVYKLLQTGRFPGVKIGRLWRFKKELIDQWLMTQTNLDDSIDFHAVSATPSPAIDREEPRENLKNKGSFLKDRLTPAQIEILKSYDLDSPIALIGQLVTSRGKKRVCQLLGLSDEQCERLASSLSNYLNQQL